MSSWSEWLARMDNMAKIAKYTLIILVTLSLLILLWQFRIAIIIFLLSLATAAAFQPIIDFFVRLKISRGWALLLAYLSTLLVIVGLLIAISGPFIQDLQQITDDFTRAYERIKADWPLGGSSFQRLIAEQLPEPQRLFDTLASETGLTLAQSIFGVAANFFDLIGKIGIILILSIYWSADRVRFERLWLSLIPVDQRRKARDIWRAIESGVGDYIHSEVIQSVIAILLLWLGYSVIGLPYGTLLAMIGALFLLIPQLGALLAMIPPLVLGLGISTSLGILAAFYTLLVLIVLEFIVEARFFPRQRYSSLLVVLFLIALGLSSGLIGVIFAPPLAAAIQSLLSNLSLFQAIENDELRSKKIETLNNRLAEVRNMIMKSEESPPPELSNLLERLENLISKTEAHLE